MGLSFRPPSTSSPSDDSVFDELSTLQKLTGYPLGAGQSHWWCGACSVGLTTSCLDSSSTPSSLWSVAQNEPTEQRVGVLCGHELLHDLSRFKEREFSLPLHAFSAK